MFFNFFKPYFYIIIFFVLIICIFTPVLAYHDLNLIYVPENTNFMNSYGFYWPTPGCTKISSYFGPRNSPTVGASSYHKGIDIAATPGTNIYSVLAGRVINVGFIGSAGCCVIVQSNNYTISYCHVSPNFKVFIGQNISQGQLIAQVGPKNVYGFPSNIYKDSNGEPTNGATTRSSFTFNHKKRRHSRQSIKFFYIIPVKRPMLLLELFHIRKLSYTNNIPLFSIIFFVTRIFAIFIITFSTFIMTTTTSRTTKIISFFIPL